MVLGACSGQSSGRLPGGSGEGGDAAGAGDPVTTTAYVDQIRQGVVDKVDLLFVVDNSRSMTDKQELLAEAVPHLIQRLVTPPCIRRCSESEGCTVQQERDGIPLGTSVTAAGVCTEGEPQLTPVQDLHVAIVTSSLGSHGASGAKDACVLAAEDEHAHLLGKLRNLPDTWADTGFLAWDAAGIKTPAGDRDVAGFNEKLAEMVRSAGEQGCGYESTLEAWYRFLVDPEPPQSIMVKDGRAAPQGIDEIVLSQRAQFLRPDSLVGIVMLTDENDCSIVDQGYGYLVASAATPMFRSTSQCLINPNDRCCQSCGEAEARAGCPPVPSDSECKKGAMLDAGADADDLNLRCWAQKRRFGMDLLYPTSRYVDALTSKVVTSRSGEKVGNPLFRAMDGGEAREEGLVFLAGIIGVPWQDVADDESLSGAALRYLTAFELEQGGRWALMLGEPEGEPGDPPILPTDPLMIETPDERIGTHPLINFPLAPSTSKNPRANPINGHEQVNVGNRDLQYACTFPLAKPRVCEPDDPRGCECPEQDLPANRPLCQPPGGGDATTTQYYASAYPGLRHLAVLRGLREQAIVASACPKVLDETQPDYGYNPAMDALVDRMREALKARCFPRELPVRDDASVACTVVEARAPEQPCDCFGAGVGEVTEAVATSTRKAMQDQLLCGVPGTVDCASICLCEIPQLQGAALVSCQNDPAAPASPGFCYINGAEGEAHVGNPALLGSCAPDALRLIRFTGRTLARGSTAWLSCETP
jgi:hypothetical protein